MIRASLPEWLLNKCSGGLSCICDFLGMVVDSGEDSDLYSDSTSSVKSTTAAKAKVLLKLSFLLFCASFVLWSLETCETKASLPGVFGRFFSNLQYFVWTRVSLGRK